jgi:hypothetical protein
MFVCKSKMISWAGHVARMDENISVYRVLIGKPEFKRPLRNLRVDSSVIRVLNRY